MAEYRLHFKRGKAGRACRHAEYILRENNYKGKTEDLIYKESGNMDSFINPVKPTEFWEKADKNERVNGAGYREFELNIPNELTHEQGIGLIQKFVKEEIGEDYPYSFAIHETTNDSNEKNLHCHVMFSERKLDDVGRTCETFFKRANTKNPSKGGARKDRGWQSKGRLLRIRKTWEILQNQGLEKNGFSARVSCKTLKQQKEEAIQNNELKKAELLDRQSISLGGKIFNKLRKNGFNKLEKKEQELVNKFNRNKKIRIKKQREYDIKTGKILPSEKECIDNLNKIEKIDEAELKRRALNICSRGRLFKDLKALRKTEKLLIVSPQSKKLRTEQNELQNQLLKIANKYTNTNSYNKVLNKISNDFIYDKSLYLKALKEKYNKNFTYESNKTKYKNIENKFEIKYRNSSFEDVKYRLKELELENTRELANNVLSKFKLEGLTKEVLRINEEKIEVEEQKQMAQILNDKEKLISLKKTHGDLSKNLEEKTTLYNDITKELEKNQDKVTDLEDIIILNKKLETKFLKDKLKTLNKSLDTELETHFKTLVKLEKAKKDYEYYSKENTDNKYSRTLYKTRKKIDILETEFIESNKKYNELTTDNKFKKELKEITKQNKANLELSIRKTEKYGKAKTKLDKILSKTKYKHGYTDIQLLALNKVTKGDFNKNSLKKKSLEKEIKKLDLELKSSSVVSILKKTSLNKKISEKNMELSKVTSKENTMMLKNKGTYDLTKAANLLTQNYINAHKSVSTTLNKEKENKNIHYRVLKTTRSLEEKEPVSYSRYRGTKLQNLVKFGKGNVLTSLSKLLSINNKQTSNNLEINLNKEEQEWER